MGFVVHKRTRSVSQDRTIKVTSAGMLSLSPAVVEMLGEAKAVQLLFDAQTNRVGIRPVKRGKRHSYALVHPANSQRRAISGRGFLKTHGFKEDDKGKFKTQTFEAKQKNNMVVFSLKK